MMLVFRLYTLMLIRWGFVIGPIVILPKAEIGRCSCLMMVQQAMSFGAPEQSDPTSLDECLANLRKANHTLFLQSLHNFIYEQTWT
uniref:Uncharacterized protein n=1 Tax=Helianthus annuus TaxID=4232 RepID=A0A251USA9_HELAN